MPRLATFAGAFVATLALSLSAQASVSTYQSLSGFQAGTASQVSAHLVDFETPATSLGTAAFTALGSVGAGTPLQPVLDEQRHPLPGRHRRRQLRPTHQR